MLDVRNIFCKCHFHNTSKKGFQPKNFLNSMHSTEVRYASFFSGGFITVIVVNPPERKPAKRTYVHRFKSAILAIFQTWQNGTFKPMYGIQKKNLPIDFF